MHSDASQSGSLVGHGHKIVENAAGITYSGSASAVLFWGLHISDIAVILSAMASVCGVALQFYVAMRRIRRIERHDAERD